MCQTVGFRVELGIGPAAAGERVMQRGAAAEAGDVAQKTVQIGKARFERLAEHGYIIGVLVLQNWVRLISGSYKR